MRSEGGSVGRFLRTILGPHGEMRRNAIPLPSIGLEPGGAGDDVIPGIVGVVEHWDDGAFRDIISSIECPPRDIRPAGSPEMIEDSVV